MHRFARAPRPAACRIVRRSGHQASPWHWSSRRPRCRAWASTPNHLRRPTSRPHLLRSSLPRIAPVRPGHLIRMRERVRPCRTVSRLDDGVVDDCCAALGRAIAEWGVVQGGPKGPPSKSSKGRRTPTRPRSIGGAVAPTSSTPTAAPLRSSTRHAATLRRIPTPTTSAVPRVGLTSIAGPCPGSRPSGQDTSTRLRERVRPCRTVSGLGHGTGPTTAVPPLGALSQSGSGSREGSPPPSPHTTGRTLWYPAVQPRCQFHFARS